MSELNSLHANKKTGSASLACSFVIFSRDIYTVSVPPILSQIVVFFLLLLLLLKAHGRAIRITYVPRGRYINK